MWIGANLIQKKLRQQSTTVSHQTMSANRNDAQQCRYPLILGRVTAREDISQNQVLHVICTHTDRHVLIHRISQFFYQEWLTNSSAESDRDGMKALCV